MKIKREIVFPTTPDEIKVQHLQKYMMLSETQRKDPVKLVELFAEGLMHFINTSEGLSIGEQLVALFARPVDFTQTFMWRDVEYGFIPNLEELTMGEYSDIQTLEQMDLWNNIHKVLTILYRPITEKQGDDYLIEPYKGINTRLADDWKTNLTSDVAVGSIAFFFILQKSIESSFLQSSEGKKLLKKGLI